VLTIDVGSEDFQFVSVGREIAVVSWAGHRDLLQVRGV
jgi:hypothetical protein